MTNSFLSMYNGLSTYLNNNLFQMYTTDAIRINFNMFNSAFECHLF